MTINPIKRIINIALTAANVVVVGCLLMAAYGGAINPDKMAWPQLVVMTLPLWGALAIVMTVVSFLVHRRAAILPAAGLLLASPSLLTISPLNIGSGNLSDEEKGRSFTFMTFNTYALNDLELGFPKPEWGNRSLSLVIREQPDIACIQEGGPILEVDWPWTNAQADSLKAIYPHWHNETEDGMFILSKFPLKVIPVEIPEEWATCSFQAYMVDIQGHPTMVINSHLQSIGLNADDKALFRELTNRHNITRPTRTELSEVKHQLVAKLLDAFRLRAKQARYIRDFIETHEAENILLAGDFNDVQCNYAYRTLRSLGLRDAYSDAAFGPTITYLDNRFYFHIDQVLYRGALKAVDIVRGKMRTSDHSPLTTTFVWDEATPSQSADKQ